jgi:DNA replication protein DnaC
MRSHEKTVQRPTVLLDHYLKQLRLPTVLREYKTEAARCAKEGEDYVAFLARLCERELLDREQRAALRRIKAARFPILKTLDTFDFAAQPSIHRGRVLELMRGEYLDAHENILFLGNPGTGKTHLATALGHAACAQGKRVRFLPVVELVSQLLEAREDRQLQRLRRQLDAHHLLVLDEFGYVPFSKTGAELLFDVVSRAYERQSIILTSNLPFEQWTEILGNERLTGALLDRLTHRVHILEANGESYRLKDAKKRTKRQQRENPEKPASPSGEG